MIRSHYIAASGMMLQRRKMEVITNNIVNVETSGYKRDNLISRSFDDVMIQRIHDNNGGIAPHRIVNRRRNVGPLDFGVHVDFIDTDYSQGYLETTELPTDFALIGDAYFVLETPAGTRYSRAGALNVDPEGYLCNADGFYVQGLNGRIHTGGLDFVVNEIGDITVDGEYIDTFALVDFETPADLRKQGHNLFLSPEGAARPATDIRIRQYTLEMSNVEISREMVDMMMVYRAYETNQRILTMLDETVGKAVNDIARFR
ncbi:MAG: flagellar hook-basal body protein [Clostridiales bacterium]|nr:flagellar hook-basal body protein [Clostridiales bacterium]